MVDEESPIFKEVANAPAPITQRIADMITEEILVRFTPSGCDVENKVDSVENVYPYKVKHNFPNSYKATN